MLFIKIIKKNIKALVLSIGFFLGSRKNESLIVTMPRSGTHLTFGLLNVCYSIKLGYEPNLGVTDKGYATFAKLQLPFDERSIFADYHKMSLWHSHLPYSEIVPIRKKYCNTIVLIREPLSGIKSYIMHALNARNDKSIFNKREISLVDFEILEKQYNFLSHYALFLKSWLKEKSNPKKKNIVVFDNKFIKKKPLKYLAFLNRFYSFGFTEFEMSKAVELLDYDRVKKMSSSSSIRISKNSLNFSQEVADIIKKKCEGHYMDLLKISDNEYLK